MGLIYTNELVGEILGAAERAYEYTLEGYSGIQKFTRQDIARSPTCRVVSVALGLELSEKGIPVKPDSRQGVRIDEHRYLTLQTNLGELVIDPTWKQFTPIGPIHPNFSDVAIATREEMIYMAERAGISEVDRRFWAPKGMFEEPDNRPVYEKIAAAIDAGIV
ncbi:hypothetical protein KDA00_03150 [Candidatus Saccharibacteria bacterium]|nr:hypothetical protein [Candidatus Saccharibacteria bacterium]